MGVSPMMAAPGAARVAGAWIPKETGGNAFKEYTGGNQNYPQRATGSWRSARTGKSWHGDSRTLKLLSHASPSWPRWPWRAVRRALTTTKAISAGRSRAQRPPATWARSSSREEACGGLPRRPGREHACRYAVRASRRSDASRSGSGARASMAQRLGKEPFRRGSRCRPFEGAGIDCGYARAVWSR